MVTIQRDELDTATILVGENIWGQVGLSWIWSAIIGSWSSPLSCLSVHSGVSWLKETTHFPQRHFAWRILETYLLEITDTQMKACGGSHTHCWAAPLPGSPNPSVEVLPRSCFTRGDRRGPHWLCAVLSTEITLMKRMPHPLSCPRASPVPLRICK